MVEINGKVYRNLQEQVEKNKEDIEELNTEIGNYYTKGEIDLITATKVDKSVYFEDDISPEQFNIKQPSNYNDAITLQAIQDDNSHPCDAKLYVKPSKIWMNVNDYNHGDNDDTYTGEIEVTDSGVKLTATDGEDTTVLEVGTDYVRINGDLVATTDQLPHLYRHNVFMTVELLNAGVLDTNYTAVIRFQVYNNENTAYTTNNIVSKVNSYISIPATGYAHNTVSENQYFVYSIKKNILDNTKLEIELGSADYTPAGGVNAIIGNIVYFQDTVITII